MLECVTFNLVWGNFKIRLGLKGKMFGHISSLLFKDMKVYISSDSHFRLKSLFTNLVKLINVFQLIYFK